MNQASSLALALAGAVLLVSGFLAKVQPSFCYAAARKFHIFETSFVLQPRRINSEHSGGCVFNKRSCL